MSVFKYFTQEGALRYLSTWALRITPPDQFNDPFEMRPRFTAMTSERMREMSPVLVREELVKIFAQQATAQDGVIDAELANIFARYLMGSATAEEEVVLLARFEHAQVPDAMSTLAAIQAFVKEKLSSAMSQLDDQLPALNRVVEKVIHTKLPELLGVLCLSGSSRNPLMWSHYADSHKGILIEFDDGNPTFNRRRGKEDELGFLRRVSYSDTRPNISTSNGEESFVQMALIKALDWAYEQEQRLIWPLTLADRHFSIENGTIHLLDVPPRAVRSITVGCKAGEAFVQQVVTALSANGDAAHVKVYQAAVDDIAFTLNYERII